MRFGLYHVAAEEHRLAVEMAALGVSAPGIKQMIPKGHILVFKITGLKNAAALILKQEMLAKGGEAALCHDAVLGAEHEQAALLMATPAQYRAVCAKLAKQPFGLAELADELQKAIDTLGGALSPIPYRTPYLCGQLSFERPLIMGIANITPDSFYDGGKYLEAQQAAEHIFAMAEQGADIIDIGGASSRPGHTPLSAQAELERLLPVLELVAPKLNLPISVDTDQAEVARAALDAGAAIINDIGGLKPEMAAVAAQSGAPVVLMYQGGGECLVEQVTDFFRDGIQRGMTAGIKREQFILDPGLGFDKDVTENLLLLRHLDDLRLLGLPLLIGLSNKRFVGAVTGAPLENRSAGNIAASAWAMAHGAAIIRTHEPKPLREAMLMIKAINSCE